ncbi:MAG TPA: transcription-repair coupling factor [Gammaproteobacteria bacterium]|nr:transcription-repair coupling factor [Gammaproteobacteria bacterium]
MEKLLNNNLSSLAATKKQWGRLGETGMGLAVAELSRSHKSLVVVVTPDTHSADLLAQESRFFLAQKAHSVLQFPDWETLPYDLFSPHEEIISQRLDTLTRVQQHKQGLLILPVSTLMQRLAPAAHLQSVCFDIKTGDDLNIEQFCGQLTNAGYSTVSQVISHGEIAIRGSLVDVFPMGSEKPFRIDLFDTEIESIRTFDPESQKTIEKVSAIRLLPAQEFPLDDAGIKAFRKRYRERFEGDPQKSRIYTSVSEGTPIGGIEYYLPLFFEQTETLFDYLPKETLFCCFDDTLEHAKSFYEETESRYQQRRHDLERPLLNPEEIYCSVEQLAQQLTPLLELHKEKLPESEQRVNFNTNALPDLSIKPRMELPAEALKTFVSASSNRILFTADSTGRREFMLDTLRPFGIKPKTVEDWHGFLSSSANLMITVSPLERGIALNADGITIIPETRLFADRIRQRRQKRKPTRDGNAVIRNLSELNIGSPVVHEDHGVGRYAGLEMLEVGGYESEYLILTYSKGDTLYVPVSSLHLISRYTGADEDSAPLHKLGTDRWDKIKRKAAQKAYDAAAELLDIYARRAANKGHSYEIESGDFQSFVSEFPFEETEDQQTAIDTVLADLESSQPMDRVVCGDVGFGKTEVAMRAAFTVLNAGRQVAVLVPTTLLAQQHGQNFSDRFSEWPFRIEALSRFRSTKEQKEILAGIQNGKVDLVIGTHKLLQKDIKFKNLGLVVIDEEQRFGVRHKERLKSLRSQVDILTLTATPIPRTLNMSLSGIRDLSIIATPPGQRHAIKTFVSEWDSAMVTEACQREIRRGGQIYFLHNEVKSIEKAARDLAELVPEAHIEIAHGQMRESQLEQVMTDFYHQRFNILVCTTIIETGIDVPSANTIIMNRADKFGLSQLHQLRGRVGRSYHRAYAYLITPNKKAMTKDAIKRLEAIESLEDLGVGFTLATHDLEIRGAGELLGDEQSGQIHEIGFSMYNDLLERAVKALKEGKQVSLEKPENVTDIDLGAPALLPSAYIFDIHTRLMSYKRIASAENDKELYELQIELIDRFGLLPDAAKNLFASHKLKLIATEMGITKIDLGNDAGRILFSASPNIDVAALLKLIQTPGSSFELQGQEKLLFSINEDETENRAEWVEKLLTTLSIK